MTATPQPYLVVDARSDHGKHDSAPYQAFLDWLRAEGIDPDSGPRCEVYEGDQPYAIVTRFEKAANGGRVYDEITDEAVHQCGHLNHGYWTDRSVCGGCRFSVEKADEVDGHYRLVPVEGLTEEGQD